MTVAILVAGSAVGLAACSSGTSTGSSTHSAPPRTTSPAASPSGAGSATVSQATCKHVNSLRGSLETLTHLQLNASSASQLRTNLTQHPDAALGAEGPGRWRVLAPGQSAVELAGPGQERRQEPRQPSVGRSGHQDRDRALRTADAVQGDGRHDERGLPEGLRPGERPRPAALEGGARRDQAGRVGPPPPRRIPSRHARPRAFPRRPRDRCRPRARRRHGRRPAAPCG